MSELHPLALDGNEATKQSHLMLSSPILAYRQFVRDALSALGVAFSADTLKLVASYVSFRVATISPVDASCVFLFDSLYPKSIAASAAATTTTAAAGAGAGFQLLTAPLTNDAKPRKFLSLCALPNGHVMAGDSTGELFVWNVAADTFTRHAFGESVGITALAVLSRDPASASYGVVVVGTAAYDMRCFNSLTNEWIGSRPLHGSGGVEDASDYISSILPLCEGWFVVGGARGGLSVWKRPANAPSAGAFSKSHSIPVDAATGGIMCLARYYDSPIAVTDVKSASASASASASSASSASSADALADMKVIAGGAHGSISVFAPDPKLLFDITALAGGAGPAPGWGAAAESSEAAGKVQSAPKRAPKPKPTPLVFTRAASAIGGIAYQPITRIVSLPDTRVMAFTAADTIGSCRMFDASVQTVLATLPMPNIATIELL